VAVEVVDDSELPLQDTVPCTTEVCMGGVVASVSNDAACEDGDPCTTNVCTVAGCTSTPVVNCMADAGTDAGEVDAGNVDAGAEDAGTADAGSADDAGSGDAGARPDAGSMGVADAGSVPTDAGMGNEMTGGCSCSSVDPLLVWSALGLLALRRRRRP